MAEGTKAEEESSLSADVFVATAQTVIGQFYPNEIHFSSFYNSKALDPDGPFSGRSPFFCPQKIGGFFIFVVV